MNEKEICETCRKDTDSDHTEFCACACHVFPCKEGIKVEENHIEAMLNEMVMDFTESHGNIRRSEVRKCIQEYALAVVKETVGEKMALHGSSTKRLVQSVYNLCRSKTLSRAEEIISDKG